jgi:hypothetical protein
MILPDFILTSRRNKIWKESGIDSLEWCLDKIHFKSYPHSIEYRYNSRGFRDDEWPNTLEELKNCIWCFGDSFTVGLGSPITHTWVNLLSRRLNVRCINVSMDGASNAWISRKVQKVLQIVKPKTVIVHWSYVWRGENTDTSLSDESRRMEFAYKLDLEAQYKNLLDAISKVEWSANDAQIIHSFIPNYNEDSLLELKRLWQDFRGDSWPNNFPNNMAELEDTIIVELNKFGVYDKFVNYNKLNASILDRVKYIIPELDKLDLARDGHHYDIVTAKNFVDQLEHLIVAPQPH